MSPQLPTGEGLFAVNDLAEAAYAITEIERNYAFHSRKAREVACKHLEFEMVAMWALAPRPFPKGFHRHSNGPVSRAIVPG